MSQDTKEETFLPLEALTYFELDNGAKCFIGNMDDICKHVDALGEQLYYVMSMGKFKTTTGNSTTTTNRPGVFKIVNNAVGRAIVSADNEIHLDTLEPTAWFGLPKIPYELVQKMDLFFRTIDSMYGTESIVILTYDPVYADTENPSQGWGLLVPNQENTSGFCDYQADSIVDDKPESAIIVGSAHSHPGMSAFASGTDHKDQANFDGLHITYGWMKSKNGGATEFHIELQMGGKGFTMEPSQVFGDIPVEAPDDEIKSWTEKVKKKNATPAGAWSGQGKALGSPSSTPTGGTYSHVTAADRWKVSLPSGHPPVDKTVFVGILSSLEDDCPFCAGSLLPQDIKGRRCLACHNFLALPGETLDNVMQQRILEKKYSYELDTAKNPPKDIFAYLPKAPDGNKFVQIYDHSGGVVGELGK